MSDMLSWDRSMLDCEPPSEIEEPSEADNGGVSVPELAVYVLDRDRDLGPGLLKTGANPTRGWSK